jgi:chitodextrinase
VEPWTKAQVADVYFTGQRSVASYYAELSNGQMTVRGDVFGYFTVTDTKGCDYSTWGSAARQAASASGIDLSTYTNVVHAFPKQNACWWSGLANTPGRYSWINGDLFSNVGTHELGHNFGLDHASSLTCMRAGERVSYSSNCSSDEYGDPYDVMGYPNQRHTSTWHRYQLDLLGAADLVTVISPGSYRVAPAQVAGGVPRLLRVARPGGDFYYVEFRQRYGVFDDFEPGSSAVSGVMIRIAPDTAIVRSKLIDAVPSTGTFTDASLTVGRTFSDPINAIYITLLGIDPTGAEVAIEFGPDLTPPSAPTNLRATVDSSGTVNLTWTAATDNVLVAGYDVFRNGLKVASVGGTSFAEAGLPQAAAYGYSVVARDQSNVGPAATTTVFVPDTTAPDATLTLTATPMGANGVSLTWTPANDNVGVANYRVGQNGILLGTVLTTSFVVADVAEGVANRYRIRAVDAAGNVGAGTEIYYALPDVTAPELSGSLSATFDPALPHSVALSWPAATDNLAVARYAVTRDGAWLANATTVGWRDGSAPAGVTHTYAVQAFDGGGNASGALSTSLYVPDVTPPSAPTDLVATLGSPNSATVTWTAATDDVGVDHYVVRADGVEIARPTVAGSVDVPVVQGRTYRFEVGSLDAAGNAGAVATAPDLFVPDVTAPSSVSGLGARATSATSVALSWSAASDNLGVAAYVVTRDGHGLATLSASTRSYTDAGLLSDRTYGYTVAAVDSAGNVGPAAGVTAKLTSVDTTAPTVPANLRGEALGARRVSLIWDASTDDRAGTLRYKVFRDDRRIATVTSTSYVDRPDRVGTYRYRVKAVDAAGNASALSSGFSIRAIR